MMMMMMMMTLTTTTAAATTASLSQDHSALSLNCSLNGPAFSLYSKHHCSMDEAETQLRVNFPLNQHCTPTRVKSICIAVYVVTDEAT
jgi:hypothetical protein